MRQFLWLLVFIGFFSFSGASADHAPALVEAGIKPGSFLFVFDRFGEWFELNVFTFNPVKKAELKLEFAEERLSELKELSEEGKNQIVDDVEEDLSELFEQASASLEKLSGEGRPVGELISKLKELSLKQQSVLEEVGDRAPEEAQGAINHALDVSSRGLERAVEALAREKEKGKVVQEEAGEFTKDVLEKLAEHLEKRVGKIGEKAGKISDEELKAQAERLIGDLEAKIALFSAEEFPDLKEEVKELKKEVINKILEARKKLRLEDEVKEKILKSLDSGRDFSKDVEGLVKEAEGELAELKAKLKEAAASGPEISKEAVNLLELAEDKISRAQEALSAGKEGEAFGQITSALRHLKSAERAYERQENSLKNEEEDENEETGELEDKAENIEKDPGESLEKKIEAVPGKIEAEVKSLLPQFKLEVPEVKVEFKSESDNSGSSFSPSEKSFTVEANDSGFFPNILTVRKGDKVKIIFRVLEKGTYCGGLDITSPKFKTGTIKPGGEGAAEFTAEESFVFTSYWPASGVKKADGKVAVE